MGPLLISIAIFCLVGVAGMAIYVALYGSHRVFQERFSELALKVQTASGASAGQLPASTGLFSSLYRWGLSRMPDPRSETRAVAKLSQTMVRAGFMRSGALRIFQLVRVVSSITGAIVGLAVGAYIHGKFANPLVLVVVGGAVGAYAPGYYLAKRARRRQQEIARQLSDVLDLLVVCVEAGLGMFEAIKIVGEETERQGQAIGSELSIVSSEVAAGTSLGQALRNLAERTAVDDIKPLAATLIQSEQLGAQIGPALRASSDALRMKRRLRAEEAAQKSTIKILFPLVLFILPAMLMVIIAPAMIQAIHTLNVP